MKKIILIIMMIVTASLQSYAGAPIAEEILKGQDGGGGGVIKRDGMYLTFGSAKIKVGAPQGLDQVPSLDLLLAVLEANQNSIPREYNGQLVNANLPSEMRRYFRIDQSQLDQTTYANLMKEYSKLVGHQVNAANIDLAAITIKADTFLLPPFFQLKPAEQAAILFHESLWIVKPGISYEELVNAEMVMQAHIEKYGSQTVYNSDLIYTVCKLFHSYAAWFASALTQDIAEGRFVHAQQKQKSRKKSILASSPLSIFELLPNSRNLGNWNSDSSYTESQIANSDRGIIILDIMNAMKNHPELKSMRALYSLRNQITGSHIKHAPSDYRSLIIDMNSTVVEQYTRLGHTTHQCVRFFGNARICFNSVVPSKRGE